MTALSSISSGKDLRMFLGKSLRYGKTSQSDACKVGNMRPAALDKQEARPSTRGNDGL